MVMVAPVMGETHARRPPSAEAVTLLPSPALDWLPSVQDWADQQFGTLDLGDVRLNRRALAMAQKMAARPQASLPEQMGSPSALMAAYRLLNNPRVSLAALLNPPIQHTLAAAGQAKVVLLPEDTTELGYPTHPCKKGLGPGSAEYAQGLLLHSTLAVVPGTRLVLGQSGRSGAPRLSLASSPGRRLCRQGFCDRLGAPDGDLPGRSDQQ